MLKFNSFAALIAALFLMSSCLSPRHADISHDKEITKIAFGSCGNPNRPMPVLDVATSYHPDVFIWLGDNMYGDTESLDTLKARYRELGDRPEFKRLKQGSDFVATWDDHDYGWNDIGRHYILKNQTKQVFLDFWGSHPDDPREKHEGIYTSYMYQQAGKKVQIIVLDMRTFRDDLRQYNGQAVNKTNFHYELDYWPYDTSDSTLLGEQQWLWLEKQLKVPADVRIVASSTQFGITYNGYEAWANMPHERNRFVELIKKTKANGVFFISGDVHYAEVSKFQSEGCYPLYDITASGITSTWKFATPNDNRIDGPVMENHFGLLELNLQGSEPTVVSKIIDVTGAVRISKEIRLSEIKF